MKRLAFECINCGRFEGNITVERMKPRRDRFCQSERVFDPRFASKY